MKMKKKSNINIIIIIFLLFISLLTIIFKAYNKWYETRTEKEIRNDTIIIKDGKVKKKNDGKLILVTGILDYDGETIHDDYFDINITTPRLLRYVEVYQWYEHAVQDKNGKIIYKYEKLWSSDLINSNKYKDKKHNNPKKKIVETKFFNSKKLKVGDYNLTKEQRVQLGCNQRTNIRKDIDLHDGFKVYDNYLTNSKNPKSPEIGDTRIAYFYNTWYNVTILAKQSNNRLTTYTTKNNDKINIIHNGIYKLEPIINYAKEYVIKK